MPILVSTYEPPRFLKNPDILTIFSGAIRHPAVLPFRRERIPFGADDLLDLDWLTGDSKQLVIITHGLTGSSRGRHVSRMAQALFSRGVDVLAWNFLGAGEEINRGLGWYHSGSSDQLRTVIAAAIAVERYESIALVGFSLGGNVTLKYLGEEGEAISSLLTQAIVFSVPCDLKGCAYRLAEKRNRLYMRHFLKNLGAKLREKAARHPGAIDLTEYSAIRNFIEYDERYTAPLHGFKNAAEYWHRSSSRSYLSTVRIPTTIVSAVDDPFLSPSCFPVAEAKANTHLNLMMPRHGGHMGFVEKFTTSELWSERLTASVMTRRLDPLRHQRLGETSG